MFWPYLKLGLLDAESVHDLALSLQAADIFPANVGLHYGPELDGWQPYASVSALLSAGPGSDSPAVTRYQWEAQTLFTISAGVTWDAPGEPAVEIGMLRNHFLDRGFIAPGERREIPRTVYDVFIAARFRLFGEGW